MKKPQNMSKTAQQPRSAVHKAAAPQSAFEGGGVAAGRGVNAVL